MNACLLFILFFATTLLQGEENFSGILMIEEPVLVLDMSDEPTLPHRFRRDDTLRISGSGQFSQQSAQKIVEEFDEPVVFIDLREESHGFINGMAVCWYGIDNAENRGKSLDAIEGDELVRLKSLQARSSVSVGSKGGQVECVVEMPHTATINEVVKSLIRLPVTDHTVPLPETVDRFITLVKEKSPATRFHFNCRKGGGRTTTFMSMFEMMHHAHIMRFDEIIEKQSQIGKNHFVDLIPGEEHKHQYKQRRREFLQKFYRYCLASSPDFTVSWSQWDVENE